MPTLRFHSTNARSPAVNLRDALLIGQAPDRGLYLPERFPTFTANERAACAKLPYHEIAFRVLARFTAGVLPEDKYKLAKSKINELSEKMDEVVRLTNKEKDEILAKYRAAKETIRKLLDQVTIR